VSIINTYYPYSDDPKCSNCDRKPYPPYLYWHGTNFCLCGDCCVKIDKGLTADLIQLTATVRLRKLYPDLTLDRVSLQELERRESRPEIEGRKILATIHNKKA
jgi:hypothetical protein